MPRTLLVVDDSSTMQQAASLALTGEPWTVIGASGLDDTLDLLRSRQPDAVLCDTRLGDADGYDACRSIRGIAEGSSIPVILTGANIDESAALQAGAAGTLVKPFSSEELSDILSSTLDGGLFNLESDTFGPPDSFLAEPQVTTDTFGEENTLELTSVVAGDPDGEPLPEIEIIDLATEDDFGDLEMLEDLPPLDPIPVTVEEPLDLGAAPKPEPGPFDLGSLEMEEPADKEPSAPSLFDPSSGEAPPNSEPALENLGPGAPEVEILAEGTEPHPEPSPFELDLASERPVDTEPEPPPLDLGLGAELPIEFASEPLGPEPTSEPPAYGTEPPEDFRMGGDGAESEPAFDSLFAEAVNGAEPHRVAAPVETDPGSVPAHSPLATVVETDRDEPFGAEAVDPVAETGPDASSMFFEPRGTDDPAEPAATTFGPDTAAEPPPEEGETPVTREFDVEPAPEQTDAEAPPTPKMGFAPEPPAVGQPPTIPNPEPAEETDEATREAAFSAKPEPTTAPSWAAAQPEPPPWDQVAEAPQETTATVSTATVSMDTGAVETAVREALGQSMSAEAMSPLIQATVERVVWEVVPQLAERMIREAIERTKEAPRA